MRLTTSTFRIAAWLGAAVVVAYTGWLAVMVSDLDVRRRLGFAATSDTRPWTIDVVPPGRPFEVGDEVIAIDGRPLGPRVPNDALNHKRPGDTYRVTVLRHGEPKEFLVTVLGEPVTIPWAAFASAIVRTATFLVCGLLIAIKRPDDQTARWAALACGLLAINSATLLSQHFGRVGWSVPTLVHFVGTISALAEWAGFRFLMRFPEPIRHVRIWQRLSRVPLGYAIALIVLSRVHNVSNVIPAEWIAWRWAVIVARVAETPISVLHYLTLVLLLALIVFRMRSPAARQDRLRLAWLLVPIALSTVLAMFGNSILSASRSLFWEHGNLLVAPAIAYAVLAKGVLGFRMVLRRTAQYVLARPLVELALLGPIALAILRAIRAPERPALALLEPAWLLPVAVAGVAGFPFVRGPLARWIDRRFFREAWAEDRVVDQLLQRARACATVDALAGEVRRGITDAWHPEDLRLLVRAHRDGPFRDAVHGAELRDQSPLVNALTKGQMVDEPVVPEASASERWALAVPAMSPSGELLAAVLVAGKKSHLPYSSRDWQVLLALGAQIGLMLDHALLEQERVEVVVAERTRIARELHDTLAQGFAGIGLHLDLGIRETSHEQSQWHMTEARRLARDSLASARRSVHDLRSAPEGRVEVGQLLRSMMERLAPAFETHCEIDDASIAMLPDRMRHHVLRVAQEALTNIVKHSGATRVDVKLFGDGGVLVLEVVDNGRGLDAAVGAGGYGLVGMRERATLLNAELEIDGAPGKGTAVRLRVRPAS